MSSKSQGLPPLGWSLPPQHLHLRRRRLDLMARRASSSVTKSQAAAFVGWRNRFIWCLCSRPKDRREEETCPLGAPRLRIEAGRVSKEIRKQSHQRATA